MKTGHHKVSFAVSKQKETQDGEGLSNETGGIRR